MKTYRLCAVLMIALAVGFVRLAGAGEAGPMQKWMRVSLAGPLGQGDSAGVAKGLRTVSAKPVPGMSEWVSIATKGAVAAEKGDLDGVRASCKACHVLYQKSYRETRRGEKW